MKPIRLRVLRAEADVLLGDLTVWASVSGVDPEMTVSSTPEFAENSSLPILYEVYVSPSFFEQFPKWCTYIEQ